jgi:capsule polysaccharide export protein KpsE/RkpR
VEKKIDIVNKYSDELSDIQNKLQQLKDRQVYEISNVRGDGYLANNVEQLKKMISKLLYKIEYGKDSITDEIAELFFDIKK